MSFWIRLVRGVWGLRVAIGDWFALLWTDRANFLGNVAAHLDLVVEAIGMASAVGIPLGILASRSSRVERAVVGVANILQTIPGLALLGVLLIVFGQIGKPPALGALVIYSLLPIIKNTILGLKGVDRGVIEAALGMGMTSRQRLAWVELPLAVPVLLGGIRVAAVASVGMATIATAIGARGLGRYIYQGIQYDDPRRILLGAIPAALLALVCDSTLGALERRLDPVRGRAERRPLRDVLAVGTTALLVALAGLGAWQSLDWRTETTIRIGAKDSAEPTLLGHMLADLVEAETPYQVDRRFGLSGSLICYNALSQGSLDAYVEYTGTALTALLKQPPAYDPVAVRASVASGMKPAGIEVLDPIGFENTFAILMRREQAEQLGIRTISDLARHQNSLRVGFGPEFGRRPDGWLGLIQAYSLKFGPSPVEMDRSLLYQAVRGGSIDVAAGDSTEGRVATLDLVMLVDDRRFFPPYEAVPLVRAETLNRLPALRATLNRLAGRIDAPTMRRLNGEIDTKKRDPAAVAHEFLISAGLLNK